MIRAGRPGRPADRKEKTMKEIRAIIRPQKLPRLREACPCPVFRA
jgi:hypothetical protein